ncbi:type II toxin-antitoxin system VapC family toxin [Baaleninema sp.]|uniref:type II toxin-antitoxin system VapC family toxin n=1 Tax=Baaleninema sp. TaxID=3101197 RepID=UPI003D0757F0
MSQHSPADFAFSIVSFHEQVLGAHALINRNKKKTDLPRGYALLWEVLQSFASASAIVLPLDDEAIVIFKELKHQHPRESTMDLRIAAIALSRNLVLLTQNIRDFDYISELETQDWTI